LWTLQLLLNCTVDRAFGVEGYPGTCPTLSANDERKLSSGEVEDEIHFLFKCSKYEPDRKELIDIILTSCPNFNSLNDVKKLEWICNCENHNILTHLGTKGRCLWICSIEHSTSCSQQNSKVNLYTNIYMYRDILLLNHRQQGTVLLEMFSIYSCDIPL
jgi:hypothetical protein